MKLTRVDLQEFIYIYKNCIKRDFPKNERRPLFMIKPKYKKGMYDCFVLYENKKITAYACILKVKNNSAVLLDYYAVAPDKRGTGIGGKFIKALRKEIDCDGIILECEMPAKAKNSAEKNICNRRISFYVKNGAELSKYGWYAFKVDYNLLWLPVNKTLEDRNLGEDMKVFYESYIPKWFTINGKFFSYDINARKK